MSKFHDVEIANSQIQQKSWNREFDGSNSEPGNRNPSLSMTLKFPDSIKSRGIGNLRLKLGNWEFLFAQQDFYPGNYLGFYGIR
jgi:hypothetical protein